MLTNKSEVKAEISSLLGSILNRLGVYNKALVYHKKSSDINKTLEDKARIAKDYLNVGWTFSNLHDYTQALEYHSKGLLEYQQLNHKDGIARENSYVGLALSRLGRHAEALAYHRTAIAIDTEMNNNTKWLAEDFQNIDIAFYSRLHYCFRVLL